MTAAAVTALLLHAAPAHALDEDHWAELRWRLLFNWSDCDDYSPALCFSTETDDLYAQGTHRFSGHYTTHRNTFIGVRAGEAVVNQRGGRFDAARMRLGTTAVLWISDSTRGGQPGTYILDAGELHTHFTWIGNRARGDFIQNGGLHQVESWVQLGQTGAAASPGFYAMNNGVLSARELNVRHPDSVFSMRGGLASFAAASEVRHGRVEVLGGTLVFVGGLTVERWPIGSANLHLGGGHLVGAVTNRGELVAGGGAHTGQLFNQPGGVAAIGGVYAPSLGIDNQGVLRVEDGGHLVLTGAGLHNAEGAALQLAGGGRISGAGALVNRGQFQAAGEIVGSGRLENLGVLSVRDKALTLQRSGEVHNHGRWTVQDTDLVLLGATRLINAGQVELVDATLRGTGQVDNREGGVLVSSGETRIDTALAQRGRLELHAGRLTLAQPLVNLGEIALAGPAPAAQGPAPGFGRSATLVAPLDNQGLLHVVAGRLRVEGALANREAATVFVGRGGVLDAAGGLPRNDGRIELAGGIVQVEGTLANRGLISGFGSLRAGALHNDNRIELNSGASWIDTALTQSGRLDAAAEARVTLAGTALFTTGSQTRLETGAELRHAGASRIAPGAQFSGGGTHRFIGSLAIEGTPSTLSFAGGLQFEPDHLLTLRIGSASHDRLQTAGPLHFGGTLAIVLVDGATPALGDSFALFGWGMGSGGAFSTVDLGAAALPAGLRWDSSALHTAGVLQVSAVPELPPAATLGLGLLILGWLVRRRAIG